jgi:hypothetical protein
VGARPLPPDSLSGLLEPTLEDHVARAQDDARPWRVGSQIYVAIIGGPIALAIIALDNCRRLRLPTRQRVAVAAACVAATVLAVVLMLVLPGEGAILAQLAGAAAAGPAYLIMRSYDRAYYAFSPLDEDDAYESLWGPGIVAVLIGGIAIRAIDALVGG